MQLTTAPRHTKKAQLSWALMDWARDPFLSLMLSFVYPAYFVSVLAENSVEGQALWAMALVTGAIGVAILAPILGARSDHAGRHKPWVAACSVIVSVSVTWLWFVTPDLPFAVPIAFVIIAIGVAAIELSVVFTSAMLPAVSPPDRVSSLSGIGLALGFTASMLVFLILWITDVDIEGGAVSDTLYRASGPIAGLWLLVFSIPLLVFVKEARKPLEPSAAIRGNSWVTLVSTFRELAGYRNIVLLIASRTAFYNAIVAFNVFLGVYASGLWTWTPGELALLGLVTMLGASVGAGIGGWVAEVAGARRTLIASVAGFTFMLICVASIGTHGFLWETTAAMAPAGPEKSDGPIGMQWIFILTCGLTGCVMGSAVGTIRAFIVKVTPAPLLARSFGVAGTLGQIGAIAGQLAIGQLTFWAGDQRIGLFGVLIAMTLLGLITLFMIEEDTKTSDVP